MPFDPSDGGNVRAVLTWLRGQAWRIGSWVWRLCRFRIPARWMIGAGILFLIVMLWMPPGFFGGPRPAARRAACLSNLKQLGMALSMYVEDHDGNLPDLPAGPPDLRPLVSGYFKMEAPEWLWHCPSRSWDDLTRRPVSYGYNYLGLARNGKGISVSEIANPENLLVLVDSDGPRAVPHGLSGVYPGTPPEYRHEGRSNALWLDGRVTSRRSDEIEVRSGTTGTLRDFPRWKPEPRPAGR